MFGIFGWRKHFVPHLEGGEDVEDVEEGNEEEGE